MNARITTIDLHTAKVRADAFFFFTENQGEIENCLDAGLDLEEATGAVIEHCGGDPADGLFHDLLIEVAQTIL